MHIIFNNPAKNHTPISFKEQHYNEFITLPNGKKSLIIGISERKNLNDRKFIILARKIISIAKNNNIKKISINLYDFNFPAIKAAYSEMAETLTANFEMANFEFNRYKTPPKDGWNFIEEISINGKISPELKRSFEKGKIIGEEVNNCRILANTPGGDMTPKILADHAKNDSKNLGIKVKILGQKEINKLKMGGILSVSRGSSEEPKFIILEYKKGGKEKPIVLVGKGITFDSGGLNLKSSDSLNDMYLDMSGASAVIHAIALAARLKIKKNIVGLIPALENMPSGSSYRPGDVLKSMSGKTIEVLNTDAEGRIILADALTYAKKYNPKTIIDVATLTGAAMIALGQKASAIFTKDEKLEKLCRELSEKSGDYVWPMPLWEEYEEDIKGTFGDIANLGKNRYGGAITAAVFLYQFAKDFPSWMHIDIAPRMTAIDGEYLAKGAAGTPVRLLIKLIENL